MGGLLMAYQLGRLVPHESSFTQKASAGTWGCVIRRPSLCGNPYGHLTI